MRRIGLLGLLGLLVGALLVACATPADQWGADAQTTRTMVVYKSPTCGCCGDWVEHVQANGFTVKVEEVQDLAAIKARYQVPMEMQSCHTAVVDGYVVEGHVPAAEIERLLAERPDVVGIAVPGMPIGSPGMEIEVAAPQPFDVVAFDDSGRTTTFASYSE